MEPLSTLFILEVLAGLTAAGLSAAAAYVYRGKKDRKKINEAPFIYVRRLDELIKRGVQEGTGNAALNARASAVKVHFTLHSERVAGASPFPAKVLYGFAVSFSNSGYDDTATMLRSGG